MSAQDFHVKIELGSYWHAGTGRGDGAGADAVVARDGDDLPYLPGSHLRGLWRHALRLLEGLGGAPGPYPAGAASWTDYFFGLAAAAGEADDASATPAANRFETTAGALLVADARLADDELREALTHKDHRAARAALTPTVQATAVGDDGIVQAQTLRSTEVTVPMPLQARLLWRADGLDDATRARGLSALREALGLVTHVGKHRTRGLGRARLTLEEGE